MPIPVTEIVQAGTAIAQTIAGISDTNKRRRFEEALALLSNRQQQELNQQLLQAQTQTQRLQILDNAIVQFAIANEQSAARSKTIMYILAGVMGLAVLTIALIFALKKDDNGRE